MSSIRSASSSTSVRTWASDTAPRAIRSSSRPGVATTICARRAARICFSKPTPPYTAAIWRPRARTIGRASSTIWAASSRVGASTSAAGPAPLRGMRSASGTANASVLPDPVGDLASTSRPASTSPITSRWIANGRSMP